MSPGFVAPTGRNESLPRGDNSIYAASKGAVDAMTPALARELRGRDITANAVAPGPTATPLFFEGKDEPTIERLARMAPLERRGTPEDIAEAVAHLARRPAASTARSSTSTAVSPEQRREVNTALFEFPGQPTTARVGMVSSVA